jgi:hypothetical protein
MDDIALGGSADNAGGKMKETGIKATGVLTRLLPTVVHWSPGGYRYGNGGHLAR